MINNSEATAAAAEAAEVEAENVASGLWALDHAAGEVCQNPPSEFEGRILHGAWVVTPILVAFSIELALKAMIAQEATNPWLKTHNLLTSIPSVDRRTTQRDRTRPDETNSLELQGVSRMTTVFPSFKLSNGRLSVLRERGRPRDVEFFAPSSCSLWPLPACRFRGVKARPRVPHEPVHYFECCGDVEEPFSVWRIGHAFPKARSGCRGSDSGVPNSSLNLSISFR